LVFVVGDARSKRSYKDLALAFAAGLRAQEDHVGVSVVVSV
jgi:hypothetical protein